MSNIEFFLVFEGMIDRDKFGSMAIDNIILALDEKCNLSPTEVQSNYSYSVANCNFDNGFCDRL